MEALADSGFVPGSEVDGLRWLTPEEALALLSYDRDRDVLRAAV
jgi:8-oxo-dGTP diphosphatase